MFNLFSRNSKEALDKLAALDKSQAIIEFTPDGIVLTANKNFLNVTRYTLDEIQGKHHSMFVAPEERASAAYQEFWASLNHGDYRSAVYKRMRKDGCAVWIQASYNPLKDENGKVYKVVKFATDITDRKEAEVFMEEAVSVLKSMATGNLTAKMEREYTSSFNNDTQHEINYGIQKLSSTMSSLKQTSSSITIVANEIAAASADLALRTEHQASSLEETSAAMEEITVTVQENSLHARTANELSLNANKNAEAGGKVVDETIEAMSNIEKSSRKISDIISVIDEIAFQTNLLALNAAVEAARAGDAGKGFAVVASEVRVLAGRSSSASKEIKALINESTVQVENGVQLVNNAGHTLKGIVESVKQVTDIIAQIADASAQQAQGIGEVNTAITQMDETTQKNAAMVEESTAAAQSMLEKSKALDKMISFFKVDENTHQIESQVVPYVDHDKSIKIVQNSEEEKENATGNTQYANGKYQGNDQGWEEF